VANEHLETSQPFLAIQGELDESGTTGHDSQTARYGCQC